MIPHRVFSGVLILSEAKWGQSPTATGSPPMTRRNLRLQLTTIARVMKATKVVNFIITNSGENCVASETCLLFIVYVLCKGLGLYNVRR